MKYETEEEKNIVREMHMQKLNAILERDFEDLSHNELAFLKCVSLSSIITMHKAGYSKDDIVLHNQQNKAPATKKSVAKAMNAMSDDELLAMGFKRV